MQIVLVNTDNSNENLYIEPDDNGTYEFSASDLSALSAGTYYLQLEKYNEDNINATGYDIRSIIRARHMCSSMITLN